jgi:hypothetical protein
MNQKNGVLLTLSLLALAFFANACDTTAVAGITLALVELSIHHIL